MKYTDNELQAAIDAAMLEIGRQTAGNNFAASLDYEASWPAEQSDRLALAKSFLAKLPEPQPILADDGRSLGQLLYEAGAAVANNIPGQPPCDPWSESEDCHEAAESAAKAVASVVLAKAVRRMEAVSVKELADAAMEPTHPYGLHGKAEAIRARLIAAARGKEQDESDITDWKDRAEKAEAEAKETLHEAEQFREECHADMVGFRDRAEKAEAELAALKSSNIGILRPLAQAGHVPDGCVRVKGYKCAENDWCLAHWENRRNTHFADILLPVTETPAQTVNEQPKQQVPLGPEDVMPGSVFRFADSDDESAWQQPHEILSSGAAFHNGAGTVMWKDWSYLASRFEINRSIPLTGRWDANAWEPCSKPGKEPT